MKACCKCKTVKPLEEFSKNRSAKDGLQATCKPCHRAGVKASQLLHPERYRAYQSAYQKSPKNRLYQKQYHSARVFDPEVQARTAANEAVRVGRLERKPCQICGAQKADKHHEDYSKPLEVVWLCRPHHQQLHANLFSLLPS